MPVRAQEESISLSDSVADLTASEAVCSTDSACHNAAVKTSVVCLRGEEKSKEEERGVRRFACDLCDKKYRRFGGLHYHGIRVHFVDCVEGLRPGEKWARHHAGMWGGAGGRVGFDESARLRYLCMVCGREINVREWIDADDWVCPCSGESSGISSGNFPVEKFSLFEHFGG